MAYCEPLENTSIEEEYQGLKDGISALAKRIKAFLTFGIVGLAQEAYTKLKEFCEVVDESEVVRMVNEIGVETALAGWIVKAWCDAKEIRNASIEFDTAGVKASPGECMEYRRGRGKWGNLVSIQNDVDFETRKQFERYNVTDKLKGDAHLRLSWWLKPNNAIRIKMTTRNELKCWMGSTLLSEAMRSNKADFIKEVGSVETARLERITGLPIGKIWSSVKNGNLDLVKHLSKFPNAKRDQMRKRGMFVSDDPQTVLVDDKQIQFKQIRRSAKKRVAVSTEVPQAEQLAFL